MVVKMTKWSPWPPATAKMFQVKVKEMELLDFFNDEEDGDGGDKVMAIEMRWKEARKTALVPFHRLQSSKRRKHISREIVLQKGEAIKWQDEFEKVFSSPIASKDADEFGPSEVSIALLYGAKNRGKAKMAVVGNVVLDLAELASKAEAVVETKVPITVNHAGVATEAALSVCFSFMEVRNSEDSGTVQNSTVSENAGVSSDESAVTDSEGTPENELVVKTRRVELSSSSESESGLSSETQADSVKKAGLFSWKRRRLSLKPGKTKPEPSIKKTIDDDDDDHDSKMDVGLHHNPKPYATEASCEPGREQEESSATGHGHWEEKEVLSRDGESKLRASVFFAGFDQRSDKAAGESACTALVAVIAHWLQSNQDTMPTRSELDRLIVEGSSEWRKLCDEEALKQRFPDKHFDLETVVQAGLRPVSVSRDKSFIAFFAPEKFESLKGAMSFDQIWDQISSCDEGSRPPRTYIVSWNDHFFVLKVDADAYYIIDTLGERLFEGCNRAFMLRFDDSTVMHRRVEKEKPGSSSEEMPGAEPAEPEATSDQEEICSGKECCREFIKRFLAAIPLRELEEQETKEAVSYFALHQRLQIEFNYCSSPPDIS
ncbi:uncharacterized protein LOC127813474 [Diospyros lotus]|uniref:uncharacterized protein LOC127813474 n=1 Tax=Diospyros lotus TaxID=55363 RepID=UPI002255A141|nr:uncharacterized protein LOC127813474 [Diospyros lotus]